MNGRVVYDENDVAEGAAGCRVMETKKYRDGQWTVNSGQWTVESGQGTVK